MQYAAGLDIVFRNIPQAPIFYTLTQKIIYIYIYIYMLWVLFRVVACVLSILQAVTQIAVRTSREIYLNCYRTEQAQCEKSRLKTQKKNNNDTLSYTHTHTEKRNRTSGHINLSPLLFCYSLSSLKIKQNRRSIDWTTHERCFEKYGQFRYLPL